MSIHTDKARKIARERGGYAGRDDAAALWKLSKRELVEIAIRLGETSAEGHGPENAISRVREELQILQDNGIL